MHTIGWKPNQFLVYQKLNDQVRLPHSDRSENDLQMLFLDWLVNKCLMWYVLRKKKHKRTDRRWTVRQHRRCVK